MFALVALAAIALVAVTATMIVTARDGRRRMPTLAR